MTVLILVLLVLILLELTQQLPLQCSCGVFLCNLIDMSMTEGVICLVAKNIAFYTFLCIPIASRLVTETQKAS
jgi:hypothetical protein